MRNDSKIEAESQQVSPDVSQKILQDKSSTGKPRKWSTYKKQSLAVSDAYRKFEGDATFSKRMEECGGWLRFLACSQGHGLLLIAAIFCQCRLCPLCQWRRSLIIFHQVKQLACEHIKHYKSDVMLLLTLTVPNMKANDLSERITLMQKSWKRLIERKAVSRVCRSWFRSLEITYNESRDDYHPHFHVLLMVPKNYFEKKYDLYIERDEWLLMWQEVTGLPDITQVDIRKVKNLKKGDAITTVAAEIAKYATKPSDYVKEKKNGLCEADVKVIEALHVAIRRRRLVAFGGEFKRYKQALKLAEVEEADMVKIDEKEKTCHCRVCESELLPQMYRWQIGLRQYVKTDLLETRKQS